MLLLSAGVSKWRPWDVDGGKPLYRTPLNTTVPADLGGTVSFQALSIVRCQDFLLCQDLLSMPLSLCAL